jgi:di/tricarboxylate transporter
MTLDIALVLGILGVALFLLVSGRVRMDVVALVVLASLALLGLVSAQQAVAGFSNAAVIAVWAMFILSEGLTRTGISDLISKLVLRLAGHHEIRMVGFVMLSAGALSAFMSNIGVAALMLPVVVDISRRTRIPASRLLMPLAYASLLGGMTTMIGTPPNLLISAALAANGHEPFQIFDFTPLGLVLLAAGTAFVAIVGRHWLPEIKPEIGRRRRSQRNLRRLYGLHTRNYEMRISVDSILVGKTLAQSRIGTATGLIVMALERDGKTELMPSRRTVLQAGDKLFVQGQLDRFNEFRRWSELVIEREAPVLQGLVSGHVSIIEVGVAEDSPLLEQTLSHSDFLERYGANLLAIRRGDIVRREGLVTVPLRGNDVLLLQAEPETAEQLARSTDFSGYRTVPQSELTDVYRLQEHLFVVRVPRESDLAVDSLRRSRFGDAFDFHLLGIFREGALMMFPPADAPLVGGDLLLVQSREEDLDVLRGLQELETIVVDTTSVLEGDRLALTEATLEPRSSFIGKPVRALDLRDRYGVELVAVWRNGEPIRSNLDNLVLKLGDALLILGPREKLRLVESDSNFLMLTRLGQRPQDTSKAPIAGAIIAAVVASVIAGWLELHIAAIAGATLMVLSRCLTMDEAYAAIEWRAIFLIAGMLPLGAAMEDTGAARLLAEATLNVLGPLGLWWVIGGLFIVTAIATIIIPTAAVVVLMSPVVLSAMADFGVEPHAAMMAVAMAASASFSSPISHPSNLLVMGPGGYRFIDYLKVGLPLTILLFVLTMLTLPVLWPSAPLAPR